MPARFPVGRECPLRTVCPCRCLGASLVLPPWSPLPQRTVEQVLGSRIFPFFCYRDCLRLAGAAMRCYIVFAAYCSFFFRASFGICFFVAFVSASRVDACYIGLIPCLDFFGSVGFLGVLLALCALLLALRFCLSSLLLCFYGCTCDGMCGWGKGS